MKRRLSIGEFARLANVTTETLRYYDRIGLLKPVKVDPKTGYRYYSILQEQSIGTIKELRQLGMSIDEIKKYFNNRNLKQSVNLLKDKHKDLREKIKELQQLEENISERIMYLEEISHISDFESIVIKEIEEREIITYGKQIKNNFDVSYAYLELQSMVGGIAPTLAQNRVGIITKQKDVESKKYIESVVMFFFIKDRHNIDSNYIKKIHKGTYACMYSKGNIWDKETSFKKMKKYIGKQGYRICGDMFQIIQTDINVTEKREELILEIQIPIKKC